MRQTAVCDDRSRHATTAAPARAAVVAAVAGAVLAGGLAACASPAAKPQVASACAARVERAPAVAICERDARISSLRARFRATVETSGASRDAEGVLLVRRPGALRTKLFTLGGLTVYDAIWVGGPDRVNGRVELPLRAEARALRVGPDDALEDPEAGLSLALWALWQPRCASPPRPDPRVAGRWVLDPAPAQARRREVEVGAGAVREEILVRAAGGGAEGRLVARYGDEDCSLEVPLPRTVEIEAPAEGWRARVKILEVEENAELDPRLFELATPRSGDGPP